MNISSKASAPIFAETDVLLSVWSQIWHPYDSTRRARFSAYASRCIENAILSSPQRTFRWKRDPPHFTKQRKCVKIGFLDSGRVSPFSTSKSIM